MPEIKENTTWTYNGTAGGAGLKHRVTSAEPTEIVTWSEPTEEVGIGGYSWLGEPDQFLKEFAPA